MESRRNTYDKFFEKNKFLGKSNWLRKKTYSSEVSVEEQ